jgi:hypothetical protein
MCGWVCSTNNALDAFADRIPIPGKDPSNKVLKVLENTEISSGE